MQFFDRPGDIYHPDFTQGRAAYFDVSIRNSFNPSQIINAANEAGAATKFGESEKDNRHDNNVTAASGLFYPLVVETYGVWSTHSLEVIKFIAIRSSLLKQTHSKTLCNWHEQLSCRLWQYNVKLILVC